VEFSYYFGRERMKKVYCASPLGFTESGRFYYTNVLLPALESTGCEIIDPWSLTDLTLLEKAMSHGKHEERIHALSDVNMTIGDNNRKGINECNILLAILDGSDIDSGTASEIGYASALGKPVIGYRNDLRLSGDNEGAVVNLQVEYFIRSQGDIFYSLDDVITMLKYFSHTGEVRISQ
jgi:nucleoside 2-deoxyribosyltransferase